MDRIRLFQIGTENWSNQYKIPENVKVIFPTDEIEKRKEIYEIVVLERNLSEEEAEKVLAMSMTYCLFAIDTFKYSSITTEQINFIRNNMLLSKVQDEKNYTLKDNLYNFTETYRLILSITSNPLSFLMF